MEPLKYAFRDTSTLLNLGQHITAYYIPDIVTFLASKDKRHYYKDHLGWLPGKDRPWQFHHSNCASDLYPIYLSLLKSIPSLGLRYSTDIIPNANKDIHHIP